MQSASIQRGQPSHREVMRSIPAMCHTWCMSEFPGVQIGFQGGNTSPGALCFSVWSCYPSAEGKEQFSARTVCTPWFSQAPKGRSSEKSNKGSKHRKTASVVNINACLCVHGNYRNTFKKHTCHQTELISHLFYPLFSTFKCSPCSLKLSRIMIIH